MEKLIEMFMVNPEAGLELLKSMIEKYKPIVYGVGSVVMDIYKDFANNTEYPATFAKVKKEYVRCVYFCRFYRGSGACTYD